MTTTDGQTGDPAAVADPGDGPNRRPPSEPPAVGGSLIAAASEPGVDPCDVACEAMPSHLVGDLAPIEADWLLEHTGDCGDCARELDRYQHVGGLLDRLHRDLDVGAVPPAPPLPRRRRAGYARMESPVGPLFVAASDAGVCEIDFAENETEEAFRRRLSARGFDPRPVPVGANGAGCDADCAVVGDATDQLREYFGGRRARFELPLDFTGVTPFTRAVLEATAEVPFGRLDTYREIASRIGKPSATRAVGNALGRNPIPVVVPCHRIVRSDASLGGYTGGLQIKQRLLALEGVTLA